MNEGKSRDEVIDQLLREGTWYRRNSLRMLMVRWFGESQDKDITTFKDAGNENILQHAARNYDLFRAYGIL